MLKELWLVLPKLIHFYLPVTSISPNKLKQGNDKKHLKRGLCKVIKRKQKDVMGREAIKVLAEKVLP